MRKASARKRVSKVVVYYYAEKKGCYARARKSKKRRKVMRVREQSAEREMKNEPTATTRPVHPLHLITIIMHYNHPGIQEMSRLVSSTETSCMKSSRLHIHIHTAQ